MAILAPRERVIDTFVAKNLAKANRTLINNSDTYRALRGEHIHRRTEAPTDPEFARLYKRYLEMLD